MMILRPIFNVVQGVWYKQFLNNLFYYNSLAIVLCTYHNNIHNSIPRSFVCKVEDGGCVNDASVFVVGLVHV